VRARRERQAVGILVSTVFIRDSAVASLPQDDPYDPRPAPPERPGDDECCGSSCDPCIFDYYYQELDRYRAELKAWQARHPEAEKETP